MSSKSGHNFLQLYCVETDLSDTMTFSSKVTA